MLFRKARKVSELRFVQRKRWEGKRYSFLEEGVGVYLQSCVKAVLEDDGKSVRMSTVFCHYNHKKKFRKLKRHAFCSCPEPKRPRAGSPQQAHHSLKSSLSIYNRL